jgi:nicotinate dehydrogenase subunit A
MTQPTRPADAPTRAPGAAASANGSPMAEHVLTLEVNGHRHALPGVPPHAPLLQVLRNDLCLNGPKYGCGLGEGGACLVLIDGTPARSCVIPAGGVQDRDITTLEGLPARAGAKIHPVQQAFIDAQAAQCGYCLNGMIIATVGLLEAEPNPTDARVRGALSHNLCRCGTHLEILDAVQRAAVAMAAAARARGAAGSARPREGVDPISPAEPSAGAMPGASSLPATE